jgi:ribosomal protein S18 acetylase RimI-like enzyme
VTIREATEADIPVMEEFVAAYQDDFWARPFPPPSIADYVREGRLLVAELDGQVVGMAKGEIRQGLGHISFVYLRPEARGQGRGKELVRALVGFFRGEGVEHVTLNVDTSNDQALSVWRRLGFVEYRRSLTSELAALESRLAGAGGAPSTGSVHVQTDDQGAVEKAVGRFGPRVVRSRASVVSAAQNGWIGVYDDAASAEPERLRKLASELSYVTGAVVVALSAERGEVVRLVAFERGQMMDEYLSVPEYYGPLPPGDAMALRANPTLLARLTGAAPAAIRAVARTADSPGELPQAEELFEELAEVLGIEGAGLSSEQAEQVEGAVTVEHA